MEVLLQSGTLPYTEILLRLSLATLAGLLLGLDRELRGIAAGIRTHALVCLSSALITLSALLIYGAIQAHGGSGGLDPLRVVQGLAQAIGFIAAGTIFVAGGDVRNLTSAANIWLAAAVGIVAGAGQYFLVVAAIGFGVVIITIVRIVERFLPGSEKRRRNRSE